MSAALAGRLDLGDVELQDGGPALNTDTMLCLDRRAQCDGADAAFVSP